MCGCLSCAPTGDWPATQACAPDWESNQGPLGLQVGTQPTEHTSQGSGALCLNTGLCISGLCICVKNKCSEHELDFTTGAVRHAF